MIRSLRLGAILLLTAVLIGGAYTGYCYHRDRTPEAALRHIARAVMTEDRELFDQYVDEEAVLSSMYADVTKADGNARWGSDEVRAFAAHYTASIEPAVIEGDRAHVICLVRGDDSAYGRLLPEGSVTMELARQADGRWKLTHITTDTARTNGFYAFVDAAERYWELQGWD